MINNISAIENKHNPLLLILSKIISPNLYKKLSFHIFARRTASAEEYKKSAPRSPHVDPENKKLLCLSLYAWYEKIDGKIYGVLKTSWRYQETDNNLVEYYDEAYILYDTSKATHGEVSKEDLTALLGKNHRHIYRWELGAKIEKEPITIMP